MSTLPPIVDWDAWNAGSAPRYPHEKVIQFVLRNFPEGGGGRRALDAGCGSGVHTLFLAENGFDIDAFDISTVAVERTRERCATRGFHPRLAQGGLSEWAPEPATYDLVVCAGVLDSAGPAAAAVFVDACAVGLRHGGRGIFLFASDRDFRVSSLTPDRLIHGFTDELAADLFRDRFATVWMDHSVTTYEGGRYRQDDHLVTVVR